jgi:hypothetical protein
VFFLSLSFSFLEKTPPQKRFLRKEKQTNKKLEVAVFFFLPLLRDKSIF